MWLHSFVILGVVVFDSLSCTVYRAWWVERYQNCSASEVQRLHHSSSCRSCNPGQALRSPWDDNRGSTLPPRLLGYELGGIGLSCLALSSYRQHGSVAFSPSPARCESPRYRIYRGNRYTCNTTACCSGDSGYLGTTTWRPFRSKVLCLAARTPVPDPSEGTHRDD